MPSTLDWLRSRSDDQLTALLSARPDVLLPAPGDLATLARRLDATSSIGRAFERVNRFEMQVLQAALLVQSESTGADPHVITDFLGGPGTIDDVTAALVTLDSLGLVRRGAETPADAGGPDTPNDDEVLVPAAVRDALGRFPAGLGPPSGMPADTVAAALDAIDDDERALLQRLVPGPPVGTFQPDSPSLAAVDDLVATGLLTRIDRQMVLLPREVGLALRGAHPLGDACPTPPAPDTTAHDGATVDGTAAGQALAAHARWTRLLEIVGDEPIAGLKAGGVGVVALRRLAKELDIEERHAALHLELLHAAGLITPVSDRSGRGTVWVPTQAADSFLDGAESAGWSLIAGTWLSLRRDPALVGSRDARGKVRNVLSAELDWRSGPAERARVLGAFADLPDGCGATPDSIARRLAFLAPRRDPAAIARTTAAVVDEATTIGVIAFDAISTAGRALLRDDIEDAAAAVDSAAPPIVDSFLVQADMTVIAAGRLSRELRDALGRAADLESAGGGAVYRVTEQSLRRALDAGGTRAGLHELFANHSATGVPQSLDYLIDDVAGRHGVLRAGEAGCYLCSEDPALITQSIAAARSAGITLRPLAPTVAVCGVEVELLVETLRAAGMSPAAEDSSGGILNLKPQPRRTRITVPARHRFVPPSAPSADQIASVIARLRADDAAGGAQSPAELVEVLRTAAHDKTGVWIRFADAQGSTSRRIVEPIVVSGGTMIAFDRLRRTPQTFPIHRITSAAPE